MAIKFWEEQGLSHSSSAAALANALNAYDPNRYLSYEGVVHRLLMGSGSLPLPLTARPLRWPPPSPLLACPVSHSPFGPSPKRSAPPTCVTRSCRRWRRRTRSSVSCAEPQRRRRAQHALGPSPLPRLVSGAHRALPDRHLGPRHAVCPDTASRLPWCSAWRRSAKSRTP